jgi:hypothetical protein
MPTMNESQRKPIDETLAAIVAHPLRARILTVLAERTASPVELSRRLRCSMSDASYHTRVLRDLDVIEIVREEKVRGAVKHYYRATRRPMVNAEEYARLSQPERNEFAREALQLIVADSAAALASESFSSRPDNMVSRLPMLLDEQGWKDASDLQDETLDKMFEIEAQSNERRSKSGEPGISACSVSLLFERDGRSNF